MAADLEAEARVMLLDQPADDQEHLTPLEHSDIQTKSIEGDAETAVQGVKKTVRLGSGIKEMGTVSKVVKLGQKPRMKKNQQPQRR